MPGRVVNGWSVGASVMAMGNKELSMGAMRKGGVVCGFGWLRMTTCPVCHVKGSESLPLSRVTVHARSR